jgi:hypothetical protein
VAGNFTQGKKSYGGGIFENGGVVTLTNTTVASNSTQGTNGRGGGVFDEGSGGMTLRSTILAGNTDGGSNPDLNPSTGPHTIAKCLIGTNQGTGLDPTGPTPDANGNLIGSATSPIDPLLGPLQDNGGPTPTMALLPGSPALKGGSNPLELTTDQRGGDFARQLGGAIDMGAVEVQVPPPPPQAHDDHVTVPENSGPNPLNVLANDQGSGLTVTALTPPAFGQAVILPGGVGVSYLPNRNFDGADAFSYTVTDPNGRTASATVFVDVSGANTPPHAQDDAATMLDTGGQVGIDVLANDSGNHLKIVAITKGANGSVLLDTEGMSLSYVPNNGFTGTDQFTYTIQDDVGRTASATVTVTVVDTSVPVAHDDAVTVPANLPSSTNSGTPIDVLANDTGRQLQVTAVTQPAHGNVQLTAGSLPVYQPNLNYVGPDEFTYTITDGKGQTASASVSITVVDTTALLVQDQTATVPENGGPVGIDLLAHDTGTHLFVTGVTQPAHGSVATPLLDAGQVSYTPAPDFAGTDRFTYTVLDGSGQTATANVTVTVVGSAAPLAAQDDAVVVPANSGPNPVNVLGNDTGSGIHVTALTQGTYGAAAILASGTGVTYQPSAGFTGTDQFTYTITDANGQTATATVRVTAVASYAPAARLTGPTTGAPGQTLTFTVAASDISADPAPGFQYVVNWGDGSPVQTIPASPGNGAGVVVSHVYAAAGSYTVQVTAVNQDGNPSPVATATVAIGAPPPEPVKVALVARVVGKRKHRIVRLFAQVTYSSGPAVLVPSPFQLPRYRAIQVALADLNGDGTFDALVFTARDTRSGKKVRRVLGI